MSSAPSVSHNPIAGGGSCLDIDENIIFVKRNKVKHNKMSCACTSNGLEDFRMIRPSKLC